MAKKYLAKFKVYSTIALDYDSRKKATHILNQHYLGREYLKTNEKVTKDHEDSHWNKEKHRMVTLEVGLKTDGSFEVIKIIDP